MPDPVSRAEAPSVKSGLLAILEILRAMEMTVREAGPMGAPAGVMYAAMMAYGCSLERFNQLVDMLVMAGKVRRDGDLIVALPERPVR